MTRDEFRDIIARALFPALDEVRARVSGGQEVGRAVSAEAVRCLEVADGFTAQVPQVDRIQVAGDIMELADPTEDQVASVIASRQ